MILDKEYLDFWGCDIRIHSIFGGYPEEDKVLSWLREKPLSEVYFATYEAVSRTRIRRGRRRRR